MLSRNLGISKAGFSTKFFRICSFGNQPFRSLQHRCVTHLYLYIFVELFLCFVEKTAARSFNNKRLLSILKQKYKSATQRPPNSISTAGSKKKQTRVYTLNYLLKPF
jgi:hypothetical protein